MKKKRFWLIVAMVLVIIVAIFLYFHYKAAKNNNASGVSSGSSTTSVSDQSAKTTADQTAANNKTITDTNYQDAATAYSQKNYSSALNLISQEVKTSPTAAAYNLWGNILRDSGDSTTAQSKYEQAINIDAGFVEAYINLSNIYQQSGNMDKVEAILNQGLTANPNNVDLQNSLASLEITPTTGK